MAELSSLTENTLHPHAARSGGSSVSDRPLHPQCVEER